MKLLAWTMGIGSAAVVHGGIITFGGWFFVHDEEDAAKLQEVELIGPEDVAEDEEEAKEEEQADPEEETMETETEEAPDAAEIIHNLELSALAATPALDDASLSALEQALHGQLGSGDFSDGVSFASGGRIGGTGDADAFAGKKLEDIFNLTEIDQKPRVVYQASPLYPGEMRGKKVDGVVTLIFVVDAAGKVQNPRVEKSSHPAFEKPALDAIKQWKFEPAVKGGERVNCKMRQTIRFQAS